MWLRNVPCIVAGRIYRASIRDVLFVGHFCLISSEVSVLMLAWTAKLSFSGIIFDRYISGVLPCGVPRLFDPVCMVTDS